MTIWQQMVERKDEWIGGTLTESDDDGHAFSTRITDLTMTKNPPSAGWYFTVEGEDFSAVCHTDYLGVSQYGVPEGSMGLAASFGMRWVLTPPE